ncbi:two-component system sensor histidine kinase PhoQ [Candidatus Doolittlea endobia]|uniref:histidine kinase n=1 Tax=Candidatus Doolittlea endobia TaxID=1778262 RepID=A0A143WRS0_9ENTR|nr:two-component system sensor histidine kinase PhoQ [Candidatus Doolittlea endobia]CUX96445.1 Virulence sensor histidine kinase PhoQ [Candidatus Doolittlea endobia]
MRPFSLRHNKPFSLHVRFLLAAACVVLTVSLCYGMAAVIGYNVNFEKISFRLLRGKSNLFFSLAQWKNNKLSIAIPQNIDINFAVLVLIYDENGHILWRQRYIPALESRLQQDWLDKTGYFELDIDMRTSQAMVKANPNAQVRLKELNCSDGNALTHSVAVNRYPPTGHLPPLTIVAVDTMPNELQRTDLIWKWCSYVFFTNLFLVVPLLWLATHWSLRPIKDLVQQVRELKVGERECFDENLPRELDNLVCNLNVLLNNERQRYLKYRSTLSDFTHSLKTPLAVLQTTLRSLRTDRDTNIEMVEPIMLEQISRISQQIGYYLHRSIVHSDNNALNRELHSVPPLLDSLCSSLNKVYQRKGVSLSLDISPELTFIGEKNDFIEVIGNILDNACKYCLEFVEVSACERECALHIIIEDDGHGILESKRTLIFQRGQRADTLRPGQGLGLSVSAEILAQYDGDIVIGESTLGGALLEVIFKKQELQLESD